ncbi:MAG: hypothetical protein H6830_04710 [Planctomycetes bacterium]|nr:hypothetical protein [Planctomycetota bacterium]MCB9911267.1 hypothetical protein [Planctomycetota bacterium]HPF15515.1 hypothetical protein [Planctomycetota bacterium]HRV82114.1 hypothetical protein [Planctomycetota bacterium]
MLRDQQPAITPIPFAHPAPPALPQPIRAVPPLLLCGEADPGSIQALVEFLDFAPRHRALAVQLAQRFTTSYAAQEDLSTVEGRRAYWDRFFRWLAARVAPVGTPVRQNRRLREPSASDMRLLGLIDQYRAGGWMDPTTGCPLVYAANSLQA